MSRKDQGKNLTLDFAPPPAPAPEPMPGDALSPLTVAELNRLILGILTETFDRPVWVEGEVTGARPAASGHLYFCLKDEEEDAAIDVVMYKTNITPRARALVKDGARVRVRGRPTYWSPRGKLQLVADRAEAVGRGAILEALEKLKAKLAGEGLFEAERKRPLPAEPRTLGVVTSASGAVIHDICKVAFRRGGAKVLLSPAMVQGDGAPDSLRRALSMLQAVREVDVIILARGGGSSDDLMAFNDEMVVRAVSACRVPIVSAVGHEVDVTLCDFAADARAATPSQAAEMAVPDARARRAMLAERTLRMVRAMRVSVASDQQSIDDARGRLEIAMRRHMTHGRENEHRLRARLSALHPRAVIERERGTLRGLEQRAQAATRALMARRATTAQGLAGRLDAMSPLKVLARGYAIATRADGKAVRKPEDVAAGDRISVRIAEGQIHADVVEP